MAPQSASKQPVRTQKSQATDANLRLLWAYFEHHKGAVTHHKDVAAKLGISYQSAKTRFYTLKTYVKSLEAADGPVGKTSKLATPAKKRNVKRKRKDSDTEEPYDGESEESSEEIELDDGSSEDTKDSEDPVKEEDTNDEV